MDKMRDERRLPFFMVTKPATTTLAQHFTGRRLPIARSVYFAAVELANDARAETFSKPRKAIAERAGVNVRVLDEYVSELEACGLLRVERIHAEGVNLPNRWTLTDPPAARTGGSDSADTTLAVPPTLGGSDPACTLNQEGTTSQRQEEKEATPSPARPVSYRGKRVPPNVVAGAEHLLSVFCEVGGRRISAWTRDGKPSPDFKQVLGAVLERDATTDEWERGIRAFAAAPPDWVDGPWQIGVVFGPKAAGWVLARASGSVSAAPAGSVTGGNRRPRPDYNQRVIREDDAS